MNGKPIVSVVMGVYNGASRLLGTTESVLSQEGVDLEFLIVDDGSTDATPAILAHLAAADSRVRVIRQDNQGLTRALVRGCAEARGEWLARQDCGDRSLAGRLARQVHAAAQRPEASLVSCGVRFVGPEDEILYDVVLEEHEADAGLRTLDVKRLRGPAHHGSTLFRRSLYEKVGGYRDAFYFAQDLDLWCRLVEHGSHVALQERLYVAEFSPASISTLHRPRQIECARLLLECARLRREGRSEATALERARSVRPLKQAGGRTELASAMYFIGTCLRRRGDKRAGEYFRRALRADPLHLKSTLQLLSRPKG